MTESMIVDGLSFALPLFIMAIGGIYSEKSGITNLALEGFQGMGAFTGGLAAVLAMRAFGQDSRAPFYLALLFAALGGMIYSLLHGLLCIRFRANQVISGVVMNILSMAVTLYLTKQINSSVFGSPSDKLILGVSERFRIPGLSSIPLVGAVFGEVYPFELIIVAIAAATWYILYKTGYGMHLRACGDNPQAADAAGIAVEQVRFRAVAVSGALSGFAGMCFAYSIFANFSSGIYAGYGYLAIAAMIFGNWRILPTLGACMLFGFSRSGGYQLIKYLEMPGSYSDLVMILPYVLTLLLLIFFSKHTRAPRALGEVYDKGKR